MAIAKEWIRWLILVLCVFDGLSFAPSPASHTLARSPVWRRAGFQGLQRACFVPIPVQCASRPGSGAVSLLCFQGAKRHTACSFTGRPLPSPTSADLRSRAARGWVNMIMPGGSGFEEAEEVAERLFRLKTQVRDGDFDNKKPAAAKASGQEDPGQKEVVEVELFRPLGFTLKEVRGYGIYVDSVEEGGSAAIRGVQRGDRVLATSATVGGGMWEKSSMDGVLSALNSGTMFKNSVRVRFERDPVLTSIVGFSAEASTSRVDLSRALISVERARLRIQQTTIENFEVALPLPGKGKSFVAGSNPFNGELPYGLLLRQDDDGVFVAGISPGGTAEQSRLLRVGDRIVATQASIGANLWPKKTLDGILSAVLSRMGSSITVRIEREVQLGAWEQRSSRVMPASPLDKVAYFSTSGAGISIRKNATQERASVLDDSRGPALRNARKRTLSTSLVLLPDEQGWDIVQEIRTVHDRKVNMWPPHVTLLRPFVRVEDFPAAAEVLDEVLDDYPAMTLTFTMQTIKHHDFCTSLWLVPDAESREKIVELQDAVQAAFPQCRRSKYLLRLLNKNKYIPHITLGQFASEAEAQVLMALYAEKMPSLSFPVKHLFLLSRPNKEGPIEQMRVHLGPRAADTGSLANAVSEYASLKKAGVELNASKTRSVLLERCTYDVVEFGKANNASAIAQLILDLRRNNVEMDSKLLNTVMGAYIRCQRPELAVEIFDKYASKQGSRQGSTAGNTGLTSSVFTTSNGVGTAGASQQSDLRGSQEAAQAGAKALVADEREEDGEGEVLPVDASVHCYSTLIQALGKIGNLQRAHEVLDGMVQNGPAPNIRVVNALLGACVRKRNLKAAEKLFSSLTGVRGEGFASFVTPATDAGVCVAVQPDEYSFNIMINAYARARQVERAGKMLLEMRRANCKPDKITYSTLMKAHVATGQMSRAFGLLEDMTQMDLLDAFAFNILLEGLARRKQWRQAKELLEQMEQAGVRPDLMSYSHVITACVRASRMDEAKKTFRAMQDTGMVPNRQLYSTMMAGFGATGALNEAQQLFKQMQERRVRPNEYTMSSLVEAYLKAGYAADAIKIQERLPEMQLKMDDVLETQKIRALAQQGNFSMATEALQALLARRREEDGRRASLGAIPYNEIIKQAQRQGQTAIATETLTLMLQHKVAPNRMTYELISKVKDPILQGIKLTTHLLDLIALIRKHGLVPLGPLYVEALQASVDANEPELAGLLLDDAAEGKFSISKAEHARIDQLETRVLNLQQMSADGKWYTRTRSRRLGSGGRLGSGNAGRIGSGGRAPFVTGSAYDDWDFEGQGYSSNPEDRDFMSAEWW